MRSSNTNVQCPAVEGEREKWEKAGTSEDGIHNLLGTLTQWSHLILTQPPVSGLRGAMGHEVSRTHTAVKAAPVQLPFFKAESSTSHLKVIRGHFLKPSPPVWRACLLPSGRPPLLPMVCTREGGGPGLPLVVAVVRSHCSRESMLLRDAEKNLRSGQGLADVTGMGFWSTQ